MGLLRRELIDTLGVTAARAVLTRFGYAHGWRTAETLEHGLPWDSDEEWKQAGGWLHTLQGLVRVEPAPWDPAQGAEADRVRGLAGQLRGRTAPAAPGPRRRAGVLDADRLRQRLPVARARPRHLLHGGSLPRQGRRRVPAGRPARSTSGARPSPITCRSTRRPAWKPRSTQVTDELKRVERTLRARRQALRPEAAADVHAAPPASPRRAPAMQRVLDLARRVAQVDTTVLITGESGVGKERVARFIHDESARTAGPFVAINCGAVPETLLESELFGHARGSFTGATQDRPGLFEAANNGTLLLDEIGEVPPAMQVKLLRVLQEREVRRVGENKARPVNVRVLAATNRDLVEEIRAARFRQDLYYRLRVVEIRVPPLRERRDDILPLARTFLAGLAGAHRAASTPSFSPAAAHQLLRHDWPGNVRELENAVERAAVLATSDRIEVEDLPDDVRAVAATETGSPCSLAEVERQHILAVLHASDGNRAKAAATLGIGTATLYRKLKEYGTAVVP